MNSQNDLYVQVATKKRHIMQC